MGINHKYNSITNYMYLLLSLKIKNTITYVCQTYGKQYKLQSEIMVDTIK